MEIETERLKIRLITENDWKAIKNIWEDFALSEYSKYDMPKNLKDESVKLRVTTWAKANSKTDHMFFAVCLENDIIGYVAFNIRENGYEIGYCFHSSYAHKGYAKESMTALMEYMGNLGVSRFIVRTAIKNTPSVNLVESLGFKQTGEEKVSFCQNSEGECFVFDGGIFELCTNKKECL